MAEQSIQSMAFLKRFACLGAECEDTCCKGWNMQVDEGTLNRYKSDAPELLEAVAEGPGTHIMKRDEKTDYCVKFDAGLCGIHAKQGTSFLGDACHFYPRVTRKLGGQTLMTATLSCPEVVRQALFHENDFGLEEDVKDRLPYSLTDYKPETLNDEQAMVVHQAFLAAADVDDSPSRMMARIVSVAQSIGSIPEASWAEAVPFFLKSADGRLPEPEAKEADPFNLLHALMGLIKASRADGRTRLREVTGWMEQALEVELDWEQLGIRMIGDCAAAAASMEVEWKEKYAAELEPVLRRWIATELSVMLFPFAGFGNSIKERALLLGVRFATIRLALMCACKVEGALPEQAKQVQVIQSIARVLDHLADPELSLTIYEEPGWLREARLRALIGDSA